MIKNCLYTAMLLVFLSINQAQAQSIKLSRYLPADASKYEQNIDLDYTYGNGEYGTTELIIHCDTDRGQYEFVFTKKVRSLVRHTEYNQGSIVHENYDLKKAKWDYVEGSKKHKDMTSAIVLSYEVSDHDLYAFVLLQDHGGTVEKAIFKDFGTEIYWPEFDYGLCSVSDEDKDGNPEFYLSYFADSDGLDAKDFKQIIYTAPAVPSKGKSFVKAKATASYNEEATTPAQRYSVIYDANWNKLPEAVKRKSRKILQEHKKKTDQ